MVVGVAGFPVAGQGPLSEGGVFGVVKNQLILRTVGRESRINREPIFHVGLADRRGILGPRHDQPGDLDLGEGGTGGSGLRSAWAHEQGGPDSRLGERAAVGQQIAGR